MRLKTFRAFTLSEALGAVKSDLGEQAVILHTRTFKRGGFLGLGGREIVEVIASETDSGIEASPPAGTPSEPNEAIEKPAAPSTAGVAAARAYGSQDSAATVTHENVASSGHVDLPVSSGSLEVDREKTRKLARALAIRLERQQAARASAGVAGPDDVITPSGDAPSKTTLAQAHTETVSTGSTMPTRDAPERFVIGKGGVLLPEVPDTAASVSGPESMVSDGMIEIPREPAPRVIALEDDSSRSVLAAKVDDSHEVGGLGSRSEPADDEVAARVSIDAQASTRVAPASIHPTPALAEASPSESEVEPVSETVAASGNHDETDELSAIRSTVGRLLESGGPSPKIRATADSAESLGRPEPLTEAYASLIAQELSRDLAERVVANLQEELDPQSLANPVLVREALLAQVATLVPTAEDLEFVKPRDGRPRTIAFVGPTGVGKTTTLAKIAATMTLRDEIRVGLVTADTYRIAAVDQLRTYAEILGLRLEVASGPAEMKAALERCQDLDAVLIDTPGRSQNDTDRIADLRALIDAARPHETHLVLSGTAAERVLLREAEAFSTLGPDRVVLTKLDEAVTFGMLISVVRRIGRRISWVTTGQEVPTDVERATSERLANLMLGEPVKP